MKLSLQRMQSIVVVISIWSALMAFAPLSVSSGVARVMEQVQTFPTPCVTPPNGLLGWWPGEGNVNNIYYNTTYGLVDNGHPSHRRAHFIYENHI